MDLLHGLNSQQRAAVTAPLGPALVLAGPGSGKTRVLTHRLAYLIQELAIRPEQIVALTFTNKAAREMERRAASLLGQQQSQGAQPRLGTFHAFFARMLRIEADRLPVSRDFVIFDESDQLALVRQALKDLNLDPKQIQPGQVLGAISRAKNELIAPAALTTDTYFTEITRRVYERYQELLLVNNALDFDDLLLWPNNLFGQDPSLVTAYRQRYPHLLVDEFQDTNTAQYLLLRSLAGDRPDLFVVADPDQSIYRWRGADYRNVHRLQKDYPALMTYLLEQNYRSTQTILDVAMAVIDRQPDRKRKRLFTERGAGTLVHLHESYDQDDEAQYVVEAISMLTFSEEADPGDVAGNRARVVEIAAEQFFVDAYETCLEPDELLTEIRIPSTPQLAGVAYLKFGYLERPSVGLGLFLAWNGADTITEARVAVGCAGPKPRRAEESEGLLKGKTSKEASALLGRAGEIAGRAADAISDLHGAADYKQHIVGVLLKRAFQQILQDRSSKA